MAGGIVVAVLALWIIAGPGRRFVLFVRSLWDVGELETPVAVLSLMAVAGYLLFRI